MSPCPAGSASSSARSGVMPIPPAMSRTLGRVRRAPVRTPYGPSTKTCVPTETRWSAFDQSPSSLIVIRSHWPLGADEIENGWPRHQPSRVRNRQTKYWPDRTARRSSSRPVR